jgi:dTDP-4-dehydrorhamnose reductase
MRILITGANGQLGRELQRALRQHELSALSHNELDITNAAAVTSVIEHLRPNVVIHAAAMTDTTRCERDPDVAMQVNALGAENVARVCGATGASMVYVSTNEVFDGANRTPYVETDEPRPVNEYGRSKLAGERVVHAALPQHYVVRTAWVYGAGGDNFVAKVLRWAEGGKLTGVTDEIATPTWARDLANAIARLIETGRYGVYHLTNAGEASRYVWALEILRLSGKADVDVEPITTAQFRASLAMDAVVPNKPPYSVLANTSAAQLGITMRSWQEALAEYLTESR